MRFYYLGFVSDFEFRASDLKLTSMPHYLTKKRLQELKEELIRLKKNDWFEVTERLKKAKEYGDLSENSEYAEAREAQSKLRSRIIELEEMVRNASLIKEEAQRKGGEVDIGSTTILQKGEQTIKYTIVGSQEARPDVNLISNESPLGKVLLGKKVGETVEVNAPRGKTHYKILKIE